jgi:phage replication-related protein YjqB (UPF0714/DUF867 family)
MSSTTTAHTYQTNTELYSDPNLVETVDYARRYRRQGLFDDGLPDHGGIPKTTIIAPHGGGIEFGTSELCLAVAGYHPATLAVVPGTGVTYDYWMFEGLRPPGDPGNSELHVASTGCDDGVAVSLCGGALNALALHGFKASQAGLPEDAQVVLVGGRNATLKQLLLGEFAKAEPKLDAVDADAHPNLNGNDVRNIANKTLSGTGGHLELSGKLRAVMFGDNSRPGRKDTTTEVFWAFVAACRNALARLEAGQVIL